MSRFYRLDKEILLKRDGEEVLHPVPAVAQSLVVKTDWALPNQPKNHRSNWSNRTKQRGVKLNLEMYRRFDIFRLQTSLP